MDDARETALRVRMHELADKLNAAVTRTEVVAAKLEAFDDNLARVANAIEALSQRERDRNGKIEATIGRVIALETRDSDMRAAGGRWGAVGGGLIAGLIYVLQQLFHAGAKP